MFVIEITCVAQIELMTAFTKGSSTSVGSGTWPRKRLPHKRSFTRPMLVRFGRSWDWGPRTTSSLSASTTFGTFDPRQLDDEAQIEIRRAWRIAHLCGGARGPRNPLEGS